MGLTSQTQSNQNVFEFARALLSTNSHRIPRTRIVELEDCIKLFYGIDQLTAEVLREAVVMGTEYVTSSLLLLLAPQLVGFSFSKSRRLSLGLM